MTNKTLTLILYKDRVPRHAAWERAVDSEDIAEAGVRDGEGPGGVVVPLQPAVLGSGGNTRENGDLLAQGGAVGGLGEGDVGRDGAGEIGVVEEDGVHFRLVDFVLAGRAIVGLDFRAEAYWSCWSICEQIGV